MDGSRNKRNGQQTRRRNRSVKERPHFLNETPSSSLTYPSAINSLMGHSANSTESLKINLANWNFRAITFAIPEGREIHFLDLSVNSFVDFPMCFQIPNVRSISLQNNKLPALHLSKPMTNLVELNLMFNKLTAFPNTAALQHLPNLCKLFLNNNEIVSIPTESVAQLQHLVVLNLSFNRLSSLPSNINLLSSLTSLSIRNNSLVELPHTISQLVKLCRTATALDVRGNKLVSPPQQIAELSGLISIREHFSAALALRSHLSSTWGSEADAGGRDGQRTRHLSTVWVGHEGAGKSTLVDMLRKAFLEDIHADVDADADMDGRGGDRSGKRQGQRLRPMRFVTDGSRVAATSFTLSQSLR
eukprot:CAMPEP_0173287326 /NCGR_PEP_ID=MMETSP1143-20121109/9714_1 /TAXON_ID=483371 /ORGANISM="non described non described, Strain CCMP2298" /LENGTH=358 /DNA_ID=CAMNT_0014225797 /DNA_START=182 /DNA_END=1254 /DNA_ORIENTATION=-